MSSLTDIIFLLLIFFMLTSSMVQINLDLPESDSKALNEGTIVLMLTQEGQYRVNGKPVKYSKLAKTIRSEIATQLKKGKKRKDIGIAIAAEKRSPWRKINPLLNMVSKMGVRAILATKPKK